MNKGKERVGDNSQPTRDMMRWTEEQHNRLLHAMMDEVRLGNRIDGSWTSQAYANMVLFLISSFFDLKIITFTCWCGEGRRKVSSCGLVGHKLLI